MKKNLLIPIFVIGALLFLLTANFKFDPGDNHDLNFSAKSFNPKLLFHEVVNDENVPNLPAPAYVYYPPAKDNPLTYNNVDITNNPAPQNEPSVRISRVNPNMVVAGWRDFRLRYTPDANAIRRVGYSRSTDGGVTWAVSQLLDSTLLGGGLLRNSDPSVTTDTAGNFYITTIALNNSNGGANLAIFKSTDGGVTFPIAHSLATGSNEDKEMVTCDNVPGSPYKNNIYISWSRLNLSPDIRLIRSTDGGNTWSTPANVSSGGTTDGQGSDPCVGVNGEVYVTWNGGSGVDIQEFNKSTNGGLSFGTPIATATGPSPAIPYSQSGYTAFPSIATDISGGFYNGYIYIAFCDNTYGESDVFCVRSTDHGATWSTRVKVNNDASGNGKCHAWPWIAVNQTGQIVINYYDSRNTPNNNTIEAWMARSSDGGVSFSNEVLSTQQSPTNQVSQGGNVRFGDYIGVDFWTTKIVPVWTDERAGGYDMEIYTANYDITTGIQPVAHNIPANFELKQNYPNPFNPSTKIDFNLPKVSNINLSIFDITGKLVSKIFEGEMPAGSHSITWDGNNAASGVYFYKLTTNGFSDTKRMMLVK